MVVVIGRLRIGENDVDRLLPLIDELVGHTLAEEGCHLYVFSRDLHDTSVFHIAEEWADQAALDAHVASEHYRSWARTLRGMTVLERVAVVYAVASRTVHQ